MVREKIFSAAEGSHSSGNLPFTAVPQAGFLEAQTFSSSERLHGKRNTSFTLKQAALLKIAAPALHGPDMPLGINFVQQRPQMLVRKTPVKLAPLAWGLLSCHATVYIVGAKLLGQ